jgi:two-component system, NarL family, sensor histidine kinase UhpB
MNQPFLPLASRKDKRNHRAYAILIWLLINIAQPGWAQNSATPDSLLFEKGNQAFSIAFRNTDSALMLAGQTLQASEKINSRRSIANAYNAMGWAYMHKGYLDTAQQYLQKSRELFASLPDKNDLVRININLAEVLTKQSKIADATRYLLQADSLCNQTGNLPFQTNVRRQLAIVYREAGDYTRSAVYFNQALQGFEQQKDYFRYASTGVSLSILYRNLKQMDSSLLILKRCLQLARQKPDNIYQVAMVEEHLAETWLAKENYPEALQHYTTAYNIFQQLNNRADLAYEAFCLGRTYAKLKRFNEAEDYLLRAYHINDSLKMLNYQYDVAQELAALYRQQGNWQKAYQFLDKAAVLKDSLALADQVEKTNELKEKFEAEKKESEIVLLKTKNQLAEADNRKTRLLQYLFFILFTASVSIGWLVLNRLRMKRKLREEMLRNQIAGDLHDDIGSELSSIDISSRIALVKKDDPAVMEEQLRRISQHARKTMDSMSDIVWSINPSNDSFERVLVRMRELAAELCEAQQIKLVFDAPAQAEAIKLQPEQRKNFFLIVKEALNNAVKYSGCTELQVQVRQEENALHLIIADKGRGFNEQEVKKGNGLHNMKTRAEKIGALLSIQSTPGRGTEIRLSLAV